MTMNFYNVKVERESCDQVKVSFVVAKVNNTDTFSVEEAKCEGADYMFYEECPCDDCKELGSFYQKLEKLEDNEKEKWLTAENTSLEELVKRANSDFMRELREAAEKHNE